jgi:hypothetical protein
VDGIVNPVGAAITFSTLGVEGTCITVGVTLFSALGVEGTCITVGVTLFSTLGVDGICIICSFSTLGVDEACITISDAATFTAFGVLGICATISDAATFAAFGVLGTDPITSDAATFSTTGVNVGGRACLYTLGVLGIDAMGSYAVDTAGRACLYTLGVLGIDAMGSYAVDAGCPYTCGSTVSGSMIFTSTGVRDGGVDSSRTSRGRVLGTISRSTDRDRPTDRERTIRGVVGISDMEGDVLRARGRSTTGVLPGEGLRMRGRSISSGICAEISQGDMLREGEWLTGLAGNSGDSDRCRRAMGCIVECSSRIMTDFGRASRTSWLKVSLGVSRSATISGSWIRCTDRVDSTIRGSGIRCVPVGAPRPRSRGFNMSAIVLLPIPHIHIQNVSGASASHKNMAYPMPCVVYSSCDDRTLRMLRAILRDGS